MKDNLVELPEEIKLMLAAAAAEWANENFVGKPALLASYIYGNLERTFLMSIKNIKER